MPFEINARDLHLIPNPGSLSEMASLLGFPKGSYLADYDDLSTGPLQPFSDWTSWAKLRTDYWEQELSLCLDEGGLPFPYADFELLGKASRIVLWVGFDLSNLLFVAWLAAILEDAGLGRSKIRLVNLDSDQKSFPYVGVMGDNDLTRINSWHSPDEREWALIRDVWNAVSADSPYQLAELSQRSLPERWANGLNAFIRQYPRSGSGLNDYDWQLLEQCRGTAESGPLLTTYIIAPVLCRAFESAAITNDFYLFHRLRRMADPQLKHPLLTLSGNSSIMSASHIQITQAGLEVLDGKNSAHGLNGLTDRVGGVVLDAHRGRLWFQSDGVLALGS